VWCPSGTPTGCKDTGGKYGKINIYLGEVNGYYSFLLFIKMESELVAGFQTEHSALSFAYFFLGEYGNIILICTITANLFLGGYSIFGINSAIILGVKVSILLFVFI
jgi:hypothetical protein